MFFVTLEQLLKFWGITRYLLWIVWYFEPVLSITEHQKVYYLFNVRGILGQSFEAAVQSAAKKFSGKE